MGPSSASCVGCRAEREGLALAWPLVWLASWLGQVHGRATRSLQLVEDTATQAIYQIVDTYGADGAGKGEGHWQGLHLMEHLLGP